MEDDSKTTFPLAGTQQAQSKLNQSGSVPHHAETFRTVPNTSETFGKLPNLSEPFRTEQKQSHTITVRDAARMFEDAGVARTERSIVNWCRRDAIGLARLDAYFDPNERRYYITEESIQRTISEEKAKSFRNVPNGAESLPKHSEDSSAPQFNHESAASGGAKDSSILQSEIFNLKILNAGKDLVIRQLSDERDKWAKQVIEGSRKIGELETRLLQLEAPSERKLRVRQALPNDSEDAAGFGI